MSEPDPDADDQQSGRRGPLVALLVILALVAGGILLTRILSNVGHVQDCVMAGRANCAQVQPGTN